MACVMYASIFPNSNADIAFFSRIPVEKAKYYQKKAIFAREKFLCGLPSDRQDALALAQHLAGKPAVLPCPGPAPTWMETASSMRWILSSW